MRWIYRFIFWSLVLLFLSPYFSAESITIPFIVCVNIYYLHRLAMRTLLGRLKYKSYILSVIGFWIAGATAMNNEFVSSHQFADQMISYIVSNTASTVLGLIPGFIITTNFQSTITKDWFEGFSIQDKFKFSIKKLKFEKETAELNLMTQKLNPHFLKNMLTNIHELVLLKRPEAPDAIVTLKSMIEYMVYEASQNEKVNLEMEVDFIEQLLELRKFGLADPSKIQIDFPSDSKTKEIKVIPFIFLPFIENIFSHCDFNEPNAYARISLSVFSNNQLTFETINTYNPNRSKNNNRGIGLKTLKTRLENAYPKNFKLSIDEDSNVYKSKIMLLV
jgi:two-component system sensor histidine kinase AlgZ